MEVLDLLNNEIKELRKDIKDLRKDIKGVHKDISKINIKMVGMISFLGTFFGIVGALLKDKLPF